MPDLIYLLNTLTDKDGNILVTGLLDAVAPVSETEIAMYKKIDFSVEEYKNSIGTNKLRHDEDKVSFFFFLIENFCFIFCHLNLLFFIYLLYLGQNFDESLAFSKFINSWN